MKPSSIMRLVALLLLIMTIASCHTTRTQYVPYYHYDTLLVATHTYDSLYLHDSVYIHERHDTVLIEKWHTQYRDRIRTDTTYISKIDTITIPQEIIKEVPRDTPIYISLLCAIGAMTIIFFLASLINAFRK